MTLLRGTLYLPAGERNSIDSFQELAAMRLALETEVLSRGRWVINDRLHAHILCLLLRHPHVVVANSYGKAAAFCREWAHGFRNAIYAHNLHDAVFLAREHFSGSGAKGC